MCDFAGGTPRHPAIGRRAVEPHSRNIEVVRAGASNDRVRSYEIADGRRQEGFVAEGRASAPRVGGLRVTYKTDSAPAERFEKAPRVVEPDYRVGSAPCGRSLALSEATDPRGQRARRHVYRGQAHARRGGRLAKAGL